MAARLLGLRGRIPQGVWMSLVVLCFVRYRLSTTSRSLDQRRRTECSMPECDRGTMWKRSRPNGAVEASKIFLINYSFIECFSF